MSGGNLALERSAYPAASARPNPYAPRPRLALSLRWYLFALAGASMLPLLGLATLEANDAIGARRDQAKLQMRQLLADSAHGVEQGLAGITATAQALAISSALTSGRLAAFRQEAQDAATARQIDVVLRDPSGAQIVATRVPPGAPLPTLPAEDRQARAAIAAGRSYTSDIYASGMTHPYLARIVVPAALRTARGLETGYSVEIAFTPRTVSEWLNDTSRPTGWIVCVAGRNGQLITHSGDPDAYVGRGSALDDLGPLDGFSGAWQSYDFKGHALTGVYTRLSSGWTVSVGAPDWLLARPLREALLSFGIVAALLVCGGTLVAIFLMRRINHSVQVLHADAQELGRGNFVAHAPLPIHDLAVVHDALCSASKDIADRRVVERVLLADVRAGHDLLQAVVDGSDDLIFARGQDGQLLLANQASANLFGIKSGAEAVGLSLTQLLPPGASADTVTLASTESNRVASYGERLFELSHSALRDAGGASVGTISIAREVTQRVAADARLQRLQADLSRAGRLSAVAAMGAGLAHELHQPLSAAANFLAAAMRRLSALEASDPAAAAPVAEAMSEASAQVLRTGAILQRLRDFIGQAEMQAAPLAPLVRQAAEAAWRHCGAEQAGTTLRQLHFNLGKTIEAFVDPVSIQQVVSNLVRNAVEALGEQGGDVWVMLQAQPDGTAVVSVLDSGPGIDLANADRLFDVFGGSGKEGGLGVGLAICRTIVSAHGGWINASNHVGGGAAFSFSLPPRPLLLDDAARDGRRAA